MKLIHCADLHLDSPMGTHLSATEARERREELLGTWLRLVTYAAQHQVRAVLIAGDLFDTPAVRSTTAHAVLESVRTHPEISFFYLKGNHDTDSFLNQAEALPENLHTFQDTWRKYRLTDHIVIAGREFGGSGTLNELAAKTLRLEEGDVNIVLLHGQICENSGQEGGSTETIRLSDYAHQSIDYLALGHVHQYQTGEVDGRGHWCYPGCLEGRGFDECTRHGFVLLDIDEEQHQLKSQLVDISQRHLWTVPLDISGCSSSMEVVRRARAELSLLTGTPSTEAELKEIPAERIESILAAGAGVRMRPQDLVKLVLQGTLSMEAELNLHFMNTQLASMFYFLQIVNETRRTLDLRAYQQDKSLKGSFIHSVEGDETLDESMKATVIEAGLRLLRGEALEE